jgi:tetratricopeptide (TPR) repeat protein
MQQPATRPLLHCVDEAAATDQRSGESAPLGNGNILQAAIAPFARLWRRPAATQADGKFDSPEQAAERHYRDGLIKMRRGDFDGALAEFDRALDGVPDLADAALARAELLDGLGRSDAARGEYERVRRLRSQTPAGAPDRRYLFRRSGHFAFEIESYELVRNNVRNRILPHLAHGNALLIRGRASEALDSYERALKVKPNLPEILALKGEALSALGRYEEAIQAFDTVLVAFPTDTETLNGRGIARMALGRVSDANDDWRRQLELLPKTQSAARACVAMRQGDYGAAFHEFELARTKEPANPYWLLYRLTAGRLAGVPAQPVAASAGDPWPGVLIAFQAGEATEEALLGHADTPCRATEARFQMGVVALAGNPAAARRHWREVVDGGAPALIEYAAARNELARLGS